MTKNKKELLIKSMALIFLLILLVFGSFWLVKNVGMGKTRNELKPEVSKQKLKQFVQKNDFINSLTDLHGYEFSLKDPAKINYVFYFYIEEDQKQWFLEYLQFKSTALRGDADIFFNFEHPDWWKPGDVNKGNYYTTIQNGVNYFMIYDMDTNFIYLLIK
ncbi:MAG: hypothetical protein K8S23_14035 [Candidatus Cloacimonetes bacterium]|nr:hypothetical protein [Candidatus Cloacimonadota bacterium]